MILLDSHADQKKSMRLSFVHFSNIRFSQYIPRTKKSDFRGRSSENVMKGLSNINQKRNDGH